MRASSGIVATVPRYRTPMARTPQRRTYALLELDPQLGRELAPERFEAAERELRVEVYRLQQGEWSVHSVLQAAHVGLLLVDGVVAREVVVADCISTELLGPGDILRPWGIDADDPLLRHDVRWSALTECHVAVLDQRFGSRLGDWPEINAALIDRIGTRAQRLAATHAISQFTRVERRLTALLWHLAERWGRVTSEGVVLSLTLSHRMLAQLVGARRPTVSTALARLAEDGSVTRRSNGTWLLAGRAVEVRGDAIDRAEALRPRIQATPEAAALETTTFDELRTTLERLRGDADVGVASLRAITDETRILLDRMQELRRARAGRRQAAQR
jgi:CRP/FNR family cyclic AMP-dependent transcriptional regulator